MSGAFTDLGILLGQRMRRIEVDFRRVRLCAMLITAFFGGSVLGAAGYAHIGSGTLYFPAVSIGTVGVAYAYYQHRRRSAA